MIYDTKTVKKVKVVEKLLIITAIITVLAISVKSCDTLTPNNVPTPIPVSSKDITN